MSEGYAAIALTGGVRAAEARLGSAAALARLPGNHAGPHRTGGDGEEPRDALTEFERAFVAERDGFYLASASETGWPYVQFRGGLPGFVHTPVTVVSYERMDRGPRPGTPQPATRSQEVAMSTPPTTGTPPTDDGLVGRLKRTEVQRHGSSIPGRQIVQVLTEIPCGVESGWHTHPGEEVGYIVGGTVRMSIEDRPTLHLNTGDGFLIPPRVAHNALDLGPDSGMMLSTYIVEEGEPLTTLVTGPTS